MRSTKNGPASFAPKDIAAALAPLAELLAPLVRAQLAGSTEPSDADPWIDQATSDLGRRVHARACREGRIEGARLVGRRWFARRSAIDAFVEAHPGAVAHRDPKPANDAPIGDALDAELDAIGFTRRAK